MHCISLLQLPVLEWRYWQQCSDRQIRVVRKQSHSAGDVGSRSCLTDNTRCRLQLSETLLVGLGSREDWSHQRQWITSVYSDYFKPESNVVDGNLQGENVLNTWCVLTSLRLTVNNGRHPVVDERVSDLTVCCECSLLFVSFITDVINATAFKYTSASTHYLQRTG